MERTRPPAITNDGSPEALMGRSGKEIEQQETEEAHLKLIAHADYFVQLFSRVEGGSARLSDLSLEDGPDDNSVYAMVSPLPNFDDSGLDEQLLQDLSEVDPWHSPFFGPLD
jgi:hypothetical protein